MADWFWVFYVFYTHLLYFYCCHKYLWEQSYPAYTDFYCDIAERKSWNLYKMLVLVFGVGIQHIAFYIGMVIFMSPCRGIEMFGHNAP